MILPVQAPPVVRQAKAATSRVDCSHHMSVSVSEGDAPALPEVQFECTKYGKVGITTLASPEGLLMIRVGSAAEEYTGLGCTP